MIVHEYKFIRNLDKKGSFTTMMIVSSGLVQLLRKCENLTLYQIQNFKSDPSIYVMCSKTPTSTYLDPNISSNFLGSKHVHVVQKNYAIYLI